MAEMAISPSLRSGLQITTLPAMTAMGRYY
jgi:hypothetical protein